MLALATYSQTEKIRSLNDGLRRTLQGGRVVLTDGVMALSSEELVVTMQSVITFSDFSYANDPHCEHDFGAFDVNATKIFWKIDYYDKTCQWGSPDPANPTVTTRVLTILLASEY